jgi:hypothetical protein
MLVTGGYLQQALRLPAVGGGASFGFEGATRFDIAIGQLFR